MRAAAAQAQCQSPDSASAPRRSFGSRRGVLIAAAGAALAGTTGLFAWRQGFFGGRHDASGNSVTVLPFKSLSGDESQAYFSDGLSEELRATLARNLKLKVMAQASSATFRARNNDAVTIAVKLGVAYLLDGSVRRSGDIVRITSDLIDGATGFSRWSQSFEQSRQGDQQTHPLFVVQCLGQVPPGRHPANA